ncbi:glycoside hydrolase family 10 protein [Dothidotthia symphoricarpi CBS 119687]|uniref:Beta-xylanase n=1 Tax=Dothidotthia symphoricarpi CBS 119687 TaxID=1392245 RepID=A0A6A6AAJ4_9PLEO|nr:glycoside hydrolase family 10 protein [Dothidotthia symphoricarpi CBS 119687]KAF2128175.1 glycoside hydrolase family 10 protein [Dothidotthia symphoricarpi CBS 119687]
MYIRDLPIYLAVVGLTSTTGVLAAVPAYGQCGGQGYTGETTCVQGYRCNKTNDWYSQCVQGAETTGAASKTSTTVKPASSSKATTVVVPTTLSTRTATSTRTSAVAAPSSGANGVACSLDAVWKAKGSGKKYFGVATDRGRLAAGDNAQIIKNNFGQVTPENSMKWDATENTKGVYTLDAADELVAWATTNNKMIRGHTTVWHSQLPTWVSSITDKATLEQVMVSHINKMLGQYKGKVYAWDVVNEIFAEDGTLRPSVFSNVLGESFVALAFKTARAADPAAKLYINDYNLDSPSYAKTKAMVAKVKEWIAAGVPIDGIGSQSHLAGYWPMSDFTAATKLICAAAPECAITELDIKGAAAADYEVAVKACADVSNCVGVTVWGVRDPDSWRPTTTPLLFDDAYTAKAAYNGLCTALA